MNKIQHRVLTSVTLSVTAITGLMAATNPVSMGLTTKEWALICFGFSAFGLIVQAVRQGWETN